jgi:hypothetical protein
MRGKPGPDRYGLTLEDRILAVLRTASNPCTRSELQNLYGVAHLYRGERSAHIQAVLDRLRREGVVRRMTVTERWTKSKMTVWELVRSIEK